MNSGKLRPTESVAAAITLVNISEELRAALDALLTSYKKECMTEAEDLGPTKSLKDHLDGDEDIAKILLQLSGTRARSEHSGGAEGDEEISRKPWRNEVEGMRVRVWHLILKKASDISIATGILSFPNLAGGIVASACAMSFTYLDAVFFFALHILLGGVEGALAGSLFGSISLTAAAYFTIKHFVRSYIMYDEGDAVSHVLNVARSGEAGFEYGVVDAWNSARGVLPSILKTLENVADGASDTLADIMVTKIIKERYTYNGTSEGLNLEACRGYDSSGRRHHKLFEDGVLGGILNSAITTINTDALEKKKWRRNTIFATTDLALNIGEIIYNTKLQQDNIKKEAERQASLAMDTDIPEGRTPLINTSSAPAAAASQSTISGRSSGTSAQKKRGNDDILGTDILGTRPSKRKT
jgi:hypothetical protein